uniref:inactive serine protease PAMR1 n=1 Tax=Centroberyx gerrardi TaxID=166262 RepID=UPI003AB0D841
MLSMLCQLALLTKKEPMPTPLDPKLCYLLLMLCLCVTAWPHDSRAVGGNNCPSSEWSSMCRPCCEYHLIQCRCPSQGSRVGYTVPCCRNALDQCDPCIFHPGCSLFENCKMCHNGTWKANDDFFVRGRFCTECRQGWSGGDCKTCGGVIQRSQGLVALESYPTNGRCEWRVQVQPAHSIELRFQMLSLEPDHNCRYDYIELRDGDSLSSPVIGRFCGDQPPPPVKSSRNVLHILFVSDGYNNFDGFVLTFQESSAIESRACEPPEEPVNGYILPAHGPGQELISVRYQCHPPHTLTGTQQRNCLPNGTWSGLVPTCAKGSFCCHVSRARCAPPPKVLNGYYKPAPDTVGGTEMIEFFCKNSYILSGNHQSTCLSNASWSSRPPKCVRACREPKVSDLVRQRVVKPPLISRYKVYDLLVPGFIPHISDKQLETEDTTSDELPRGFHQLYTSIEYRCASPLYRHSGSSRRTCLKTGRWSGRHVSCSPVCGKFAAFSTHKLTDTRWPWHAAIYIRSPPDHSGDTRRGRVLSVSDQQGASEESGFWHLACSGALLTQRSVLLAAHCVAQKDRQQPLSPAHVKVVMGIQHQTSQDQTKSLQHLRVSNIVVHPDFYSALDSDLAVLKLADKAKISERVLPVCLPTMQGGEVTAQEAYTARWMVAQDQKRPSHYTHSGQTKLVELGDVAQCEREFAQRGTHTTVISDNVLCVIRKPSSPGSPCPGVIPGITVIPSVASSTSSALSSHETQDASSAVWQLHGLESFNYEERNCHERETYTGQTRIANFRDWIEENIK